MHVCVCVCINVYVKFYIVCLYIYIYLLSTGSITVSRRLSCSTACGVFLDSGLNPCSLNWQVNPEPLGHQGSPFFSSFIVCVLEKEMAAHSSVLARGSHGQRSLVGCCPWDHTQSDTTEATEHACLPWRRKWQPTPVLLPGESQGQRILVGDLWGRTKSDTTEAT